MIFLRTGLLTLALIVTSSVMAAVVPGPDLSLNDDPGNARQLEPMVVTDPLDPLHLVAVSENGAGSEFAVKRIRIYQSHDGGESWSSSLLSSSGNPFSEELPSISFCADGTLFLTLRDTGGAVPEFPVYRSVDGGVTWVERTAAAAGASIFFPGLVCDDSNGIYSGRLHVVFMSLGDLLVTHSTDQGATWTTPIEAYPTPQTNPNPRPGQMLIGANGEVWIGYVFNSAVSNDEIRTVVSNDGGVTFGAAQTAGRVMVVPGPPAVDYRRNSKPTLALDRTGGANHGKVYLVYPDYTTGDSDLIFSLWHPLLGDWTPPSRLNDDPEGNGKDQDFPRVTLGPKGILRVVWLDHRNDPGDGSIEVWGKISRDGGTSFEPDFRISDGAFPAPTGTGAYLGTHLGLTASAFVFRPLWPDRRNLDGDIFTSAVRDFPLEEVTTLHVSKDSGATISWTSLDPVHGVETTYGVVSGALAGLRLNSGYINASCLDDSVPDTPYVDLRPDPSSGEGVYYMVQARKLEQRGSFGITGLAPDPRIALDIASPCP